MTDFRDMDGNKSADRRTLQEEIAQEEARLAELESAAEQARGRLKRLKAEGRSAHSGRIPGEVKESVVAGWNQDIPGTPDEKIALFFSLFRGREDVYPRLWTNPRKGKKGYAPACENEWVRGVCEKPRVRCGECPNQAFLPLDDRAIRDHLSGEHVIGIYPLLPDETCWFLAVDFDKVGWKADVAAFTETCRDVGIPVSVERSRSGNGAHAWFFFSEPIVAAMARKMGSYLLTRTMEVRHELSMTSYDRLFPNQDTMPKGGFGNLVALPLQKGPRRRGNTVFLDEQHQPHPDQWAYMASVERINARAIRRLVGEASGYGQILGVRPVEALAAHDTGVLVAPPGAGKTVIGIHMIAKRARNTLILVHRQPLLDQWKNQITLFLDIHSKDIGQIGGGRRKPNGRLDIGMVQSLVRKGRVDERIGQYGNIIVDECHHVPAVSIERVLAESHAKYFTGLTSTPHRRDGLHPILHMQLGPTRYVMDAQHAAESSIEHRLIVRDTRFTVDPGGDDLSIQELYRAIGSDEARNTMILDDVIRAVQEGRSPLVLTERRDHLAFLADRLRSFVRHLVVLQGGLSAKKRRELTEALAEIPPDEERLVLATGRYIGEGFDDARLDTLFLAMPISWKGVLIQYTGRLHRGHSGKKDVLIFDYADRQVPMLDRMFKKRLRAYRSIGYELSTHPPWEESASE